MRRDTTRFENQLLMRHFVEERYGKVGNFTRHYASRVIVQLGRDELSELSKNVDKIRDWINYECIDKRRLHTEMYTHY